MPVTDIDPGVDYYQCLGVARDASAEDVKHAYRVIAKSCHPDSTGGDATKESRFKFAAVAYGVLGDAARRSEYDAARVHAGGARREAGDSGGGAAGPGGSSSSGRYAAPGPRASGAGRDAGKPFDLGSLVSDFLGGDLARSLGNIAQEVAQAAGPHVTPPPRSAPRRRSRGPRSRAARSVIAHDGSLLRVDGDDVHSEVRIGLDVAILGGRVTIPTLAGSVVVAIPPGTSGGSTLRLRGRGMPTATDGAGGGNGTGGDAMGAGAGAGDHHVLVRVDVPRGDAAVAELRRILRSMGD